MSNDKIHSVTVGTGVCGGIKLEENVTGDQCGIGHLAVQLCRMLEEVG